MTALYAAHKLAKLFPPMTDAEVRDLVADIKANGLVDPIILYEGEVLDGVHRQKACVKAGVEPRYVQFEKVNGGVSALEFVMSHNLRRRHLTASQKAAVATEALPFFEAEAKKRQGKRTDLSAEDVTSAPNGAQVKTAVRASEQAAKTTGASTRQVERAKALKEKSPAKFEKVKKGELTLSKAERDKAKAEAKKEQLETAYGRIEKICGKALADAARKKVRLKQPKHVLAFVRQSDEEMKSQAGLIEDGWKFNQARLFKAKKLTLDHHIRDLAHRAASNRGKWTVDIEGWRFSVIRTKASIP